MHRSSHFLPGDEVMATNLSLVAQSARRCGTNCILTGTAAAFPSVTKSPEDESIPIGDLALIIVGRLNRSDKTQKECRPSDQLAIRFER